MIRKSVRKTLFIRKASLLEVDRQNRTPLLAAVFYKNAEIVEFLFKEQNMEAVRKMVDCDQRNILHVGVLSRSKVMLNKVLRLLDKSVISSLIKSCDIKGRLKQQNQKTIRTVCDKVTFHFTLRRRQGNSRT